MSSSAPEISTPRGVLASMGRDHAVRAFFAGADQVMYGLAHFLVQVLAGRWMTIEQYGLFSLVYAGIALASMLHGAFIVEPMLVICSRDGDADVAAVLRRVIPISNGLALGSAVAIIAIAIPIGIARPTAAITIGAAAICIIPLSLIWVVRRAHYLTEVSQWSAGVTLLYSLFTISGLMVLRSLDLVAPLSTLAILGGGAGAAAIVSLGLIFKNAQSWTMAPRRFRRDALGKELFDYGKWAAGATGLNWALNNAFYFVLPAFAGVAAAGGFRALMNALLPIQTILLGLTALLLPRVARRARSAREATKRWAVATLAFTTLAGGYSLTVWVTFPELMRILYGAKYDGVVNQMGLGFLVPILWAVIFAAVTMIRGAGRPRSIMVAYLVVLFSVAVWLVPIGSSHGIDGAMQAYTVLQAAMAFVLVTMWLKIVRRSSGAHAGAGLP